MKIIGRSLAAFIASLGFATGAYASDKGHKDFDYGSSVIYQGELFVVAASSGCTSVGTAVGDYYRIVYRHKVATSDPAEAISVVGERFANIMTSTGSSGSLIGSSTTVNYGVNSRAHLYGPVTANSNLTVLSFTGGSVDTATYIKINGPVTALFGDDGCDVTVRASLVRRPN